MSSKFRNKYRNESTRLQKWDYRWNAAYFITICTHEREHYFGKINNGKMIFSPTGVIADILWYEIKNHTQNIKLDAFVVMPNHVHGIIVINGNDTSNDGDSVGTGHAAGTGHALSLRHRTPPQSPSQPPATPGQKRFQNPGKNSLSSIVGSYKSAVSKHAHRLGFEFAWQGRFWDHVIRDQTSFDRIRKYIDQNVSSWNDDGFFRE